jgi:predicted PurR-regulated permease PerM
MTFIGVAVCLLMIRPFVPGLAGALALAVVAMPAHKRILAAVKWPNVSAAISVTAVTVVLLTPAVFIGYKVGHAASEGVTMLQQQVESGRLRQTINRFPILRSALQAVSPDRTPEQATRDIMPEVQRQAGYQLRSVTWGVIQILLALFALFFLFRDRVAILNTIRSLLPMADDEADFFFKRIAGMTHATVYGTVVVSLIQGGLGGFIFWLVGIPGAVLWGVAMAALAMVPGIGAFVIWLPAAIFLGVQGDWTKAIVVGVWGALVVSTIDNILFPAIVGKEMRLHTLPVFLTIVGGLSVFGAAGLVLGPVTLAATVALIDIVKRRTIKPGASAA